MTWYDWMMLVPGPVLLLPGLWQWHHLTGAASRLALARALFGLGFLLTSSKLPVLLGLPDLSLGFSVVGVSVVLAGLVLQGRAVGSSYRNIVIMLGSIVAMVASLALGIFLTDSLGINSTLGLVAIMMLLLAAVGAITIRLLRDDPVLGLPVRFRRTTTES